MTEPTTASTRLDDLATVPGPDPQPGPTLGGQTHRGVVVTGENGEEGPKAFYIHIEARLGKEAGVIGMLKDIYGCVLGEPATGPLDHVPGRGVATALLGRVGCPIRLPGLAY